MTVEAVLFGMIRGVVCGVPYGEELKNACTEEMLAQSQTVPDLKFGRLSDMIPLL